VQEVNNISGHWGARVNHIRNHPRGLESNECNGNFTGKSQRLHSRKIGSTWGGGGEVAHLSKTHEVLSAPRLLRGALAVAKRVGGKTWTAIRQVGR